MKVDLEYFSSLLDVFINSEKTSLGLDDIECSGFDLYSGGVISEKFLFHAWLAIDNKLLGVRNGTATSLKDIGINESMDGLYSIVITPIRLTQAGHDFASALNNKEVLSRLKSEFKDAPFKVVFESGQKLLEHYMKKKLDTLLAE